MKYVVTYREDTAVSTNIPAPAIVEFVEASQNYLEDLKRKGKVTDYGFHAAGHGGTVIFNVANHGELSELTEGVPVRPLCSMESTPLCDQEEFAQAFRKQKPQILSMWEKRQAMMQGSAGNVGSGGAGGYGGQRR